MYTNNITLFNLNNFNSLEYNQLKIMSWFVYFILGVDTFNTILRVSQDNYPEIMRKCIIINGNYSWPKVTFKTI